MNEHVDNIAVRVRSGGDKVDDHRPVGHFFGPYVGVESKPAVARPRPDLKSPDSFIAGSLHRFGRKLPPSRPEVRARFLKFSKVLIQMFFPVLSSDTDVSFDSWAMKCDYTQAQIGGFAEWINGQVVLTEKDLRNKGFIKCESYAEYKYPRTINSYSDKAKAYCAPIQAQLDSAIYGTPWSVKKMDVSERPRLLQRLFGDRPVAGTDFSSMEAHFDEEFAKIRVFWKEWVGQKLPGIAEYMKIVKAKSYGRNVTSTPDVDVQVDGKLMSGDCSTSSDNFVLDLCIIMFLCAETKYPQLSLRERVRRVVAEVPAVFEGDDGLFSCVKINPKVIEDLGVYLKLDYYDHFSEASFCGIVADRHTLTNTTNPYKVIADFAVLDPKYGSYSDGKKMDLLRAKALSYAYQYQECPVVTSFARYVLRATRGRDVRWTLREADAYHRPILEKAIGSPRCNQALDLGWKQPLSIGLGTRKVVEDAFKFPIDDQIACERYFDKLNDLQPIQPPCSFPQLWVDHAEMYVRPLGSYVDFPKYHDVGLVRQVRRAGSLGECRVDRLRVVLQHEAVWLRRGA